MATITNIEIKGSDEEDVQKRAKALLLLSNKITTENLVLLSEKCEKKGINDKIQKFKNLI